MLKSAFGDLFRGHGHSYFLLRMSHTEEVPFESQLKSRVPDVRIFRTNVHVEPFQASRTMHQIVRFTEVDYTKWEPCPEDVLEPSFTDAVA